MLSKPPPTETQLEHWYAKTIKDLRNFRVNMTDWEQTDFTVERPMEITSSHTPDELMPSSSSSISASPTSPSTPSPSPTFQPSHYICPPCKVLIEDTIKTKPYNIRRARVDYSEKDYTLEHFLTENRDDWYISRKPNKRTLILAILKFVSNYLPKMPRLCEIYTDLEELHRHRKFPMRVEIYQLKHEELRAICTAMYKRFHSETDHNDYLSFVNEANKFVDFFQGKQD